MKIRGVGHRSLPRENQRSMSEIANRWGQVCGHSAPTAPERKLCCQIVKALTASEARMKGASTSRRWRIWTLNHQRQSASTTGSITVEGLLAIAIAKKTSDKSKRHRCSD